MQQGRALGAPMGTTPTTPEVPGQGEDHSHSNQRRQCDPEVGTAADAVEVVMHSGCVKKAGSEFSIYRLKPGFVSGVRRRPIRHACSQLPAPCNQGMPGRVFCSDSGPAPSSTTPGSSGPRVTESHQVLIFESETWQTSSESCRLE